MFKPMLAGKLDPPFVLSPSRFPLLVSTKLDGVRATIQNGRVMSRSLKEIPNEFVQQLFGREDLNGLDGELILGDPTEPDVFRKTSSAVMSPTGQPAVTFWVFDCFDDEMQFHQRLTLANEMIGAYASSIDLPIRLVTHQRVENPAELIEFEAMAVEAGYEGAMIRSLHGPYKQGRSTATEGWLLKLKRFLDAEGEVLAVNEMMHNGNEAKVNALGKIERSSCKENKTPAGCLGSFQVRDLKTNIVHKVSPGCLTTSECVAIWEQKEKMIGRVLKFKYFPTGSKDKPRFTQFVGWRDPLDMDEV